MTNYKVTSGQVTDLKLSANSSEEAAIICIESWNSRPEILGSEIVVIDLNEPGSLRRYNTAALRRQIRLKPREITESQMANAMRWAQALQLDDTKSSVISQLKLLAGEAYVNHQDDRAAVLRQAVDELIKPATA